MDKITIAGINFFKLSDVQADTIKPQLSRNNTWSRLEDDVVARLKNMNLPSPIKNEQVTDVYIRGFPPVSGQTITATMLLTQRKENNPRINEPPFNLYPQPLICTEGSYFIATPIIDKSKTGIEHWADTQTISNTINSKLFN
jgi:hypothetical protein